MKYHNHKRLRITFLLVDFFFYIHIRLYDDVLSTTLLKKSALARWTIVFRFSRSHIKVYTYTHLYISYYIINVHDAQQEKENEKEKKKIIFHLKGIRIVAEMVFDCHQMEVYNKASVDIIHDNFVFFFFSFLFSFSSILIKRLLHSMYFSLLLYEKKKCRCLTRENNFHSSVANYLFSFHGYLGSFS